MVVPSGQTSTTAEPECGFSQEPANTPKPNCLNLGGEGLWQRWYIPSCGGLIPGGAPGGSGNEEMTEWRLRDLLRRMGEGIW